ncbi:selenoprotein H [Brachypodium distachyon]|uniref:Selenoprotein H n=1 Tax=Brachypodium distachyon TaxID=15368 RepID=I1IJ82_BRADI|nr:selenoprotein H [Brachypodium distachyon]KQJ87185.1 hypothetical protein BRADI_4g09610v3 [Brachypodium distachyon]|eukprot:XP_003577223.1 selenoprotein H [Brachypodium distachyon]
MAPKRKSPAAAAKAPAMSPRKTRSMAAGKRGAVAPAKEEGEAEAVPVQAATALKGWKKEVAAAAVEKEDADAVPVQPAAKQKGRKKAKKEVAAAVAEEDEGASVQDGKRVVVEACTQCQHFKKRALKVKEDLESAVPGLSVIINPEKPRRGCLEIREEGGEVFISLLNMPRPFTAMKKLDMDEVIQDIVKKIS